MANFSCFESVKKRQIAAKDRDIIGWAHCLQAHEGMRLNRKQRPEAESMRKYRAKVGKCEDCGGEAHHTHHIVPKARGGANEDINYKAVCISCHRKLHPELPANFIQLSKWSKTENQLYQRKMTSAHGPDTRKLVRQ